MRLLHRIRVKLIAEVAVSVILHSMCLRTTKDNLILLSLVDHFLHRTLLRKRNLLSKQQLQRTNSPWIFKASSNSNFFLSNQRSNLSSNSNTLIGSSNSNNNSSNLFLLSNTHKDYLLHLLLLLVIRQRKGRKSR